MTRVVVNNFKEVVKTTTKPKKIKPKDDWWSKFDAILHQILF